MTKDHNPKPFNFVFGANLKDSVKRKKVVSANKEIEPSSSTQANKEALNPKEELMDMSDGDKTIGIEEGLSDNEDGTETQHATEEATKEEVIEYSENFHIKKVRFYKKIEGLNIHPAPALAGRAQDWENIPNFAIMTGRNGAGKSQLLKHINELSKESICKEQVLYIPVEHSFTQDSYNYPSHDSNYFSELHKQNTQAISNILKYIKGNLKGGTENRGKHKQKKGTEFLRNSGSEEKFFEKNFIHDKNFPYRKTDLAYKVYAKLMQKIILDEITEEEITRDLVTKEWDDAFVHELKEVQLGNPIEFLKIILADYEKKLGVFKARVRDIKFIRELYKFYSNTHDKKLSPEGFWEKIEDDECLESLANSYSVEKVGESPLKEVNSMLKKHKFMYELKLKKGASSSDTSITFVKEKENGNSIEIEPKDLSSGERMVIAMMAWQYYHTGANLSGDSLDKRLDNKVKVMLLDEPDKHLDPKLCKLFYKIVYEEFVQKQGIQVIMTTHRQDTVSLAPEGSIFVMKNNEDGVSIEQSHKLQALFHMTSNLRELTNIHYKVYTESSNDAKFYEGIYNYLRHYCAQVREEGSYKWSLPTENQKPYVVLSERYQLSFYSTNNDKNGGEGSSGKVTSTIRSDTIAHDNISNFAAGKLFNNPKLYCSYGIIDNDYGKDHKLKGNKDKENISNKVEILARHSLENYIFDPFILGTALTKEEINNLQKRIGVKNGEDKAEGFIKSVTEISHYMLIWKAEQRLDKNAIQACLEQYFSSLFNIMLGHKYHHKKGNPEERKALLNQIKEKIDGNKNLCDLEVEVIISKDSILKIMYPQVFLKIRGHDIEDALFRLQKNTETPASIIAHKIYKLGLEAYEQSTEFQPLLPIPISLAKVFFSLNDKVVRNVRSVIKPGQIDKKREEAESNGTAVKILHDEAQAGPSAEQVNNSNEKGHMKEQGNGLKVNRQENEHNTKVDNHWFDSDEMASIAGMLTAGSDIIVAPSVDAHVERFHDGSPEHVLRENLDSGRIAMAINISPNTDLTAGRGNHWVLGFIIKNGNNVHVRLINALGREYHNTMQDLETRISEFYGHNNIGAHTEIKHLGIQTDGDNCGPWTLYMLEQLRDASSIEEVDSALEAIKLSGETNIRQKRAEYLDMCKTEAGEGSNSNPDDERDPGSGGSSSGKSPQVDGEQGEDNNGGRQASAGTSDPSDQDAKGQGERQNESEIPPSNEALQAVVYEIQKTNPIRLGEALEAQLKHYAKTGVIYKTLAPYVAAAREANPNLFIEKDTSANNSHKGSGNAEDIRQRDESGNEVPVTEFLNEKLLAQLGHYQATGEAYATMVHHLNAQAATRQEAEGFVYEQNNETSTCGREAIMSFGENEVLPPELPSL